MIKALILLMPFLLLADISVAEMSEPLKVCFVSGSAEYESDVTLAKFKDYFEKNYDAECTLIKAIGFTDLPGLEALDDCDVAFFFTRRLTIEGEQLERVKAYCEAGRPIVAVRTASHGFQNWLEMDRLVLGGNYNQHHGNGPMTTATIVPEAAGHPLLADVEPMKSIGSLYKTAPIAEDATLLMIGTVPGEKPEPLAWTRMHNGARVFYTSLGHQADFENPIFIRLLVNALFWTAEREMPARAAADASR